MKRFIIATLALLASLGCGDGGDVDQVAELTRAWEEQGMLDIGPQLGWEDSDPQPNASIGQLSQALTVTNGYGVLSNNARCNGTVSNCIIPKSKTYKFHNKTANTCTGGTGATADIIKQQTTQAINGLKTILENRGWTVTVDTANGAYSQAQNFTDHTIQCGAATSGGLTVNIAGTAPNCIGNGANPPGYCRLFGATTYVNVSDMGILLAQTNDLVLKERFTKNVISHEISHGLGFGHPTPAQCNGTMFTCVAAGYDTSNPATWGNRSLSNEEKGWLQSFVP